MATPSGFTRLIAANIQLANRTLLPNGTLEIIPTDNNNRPITATAGGNGGPILTEAAIIGIMNGALMPSGLSGVQTWRGEYASGTYGLNDVVSITPATNILGATYYTSTAPNNTSNPSSGSWVVNQNVIDACVADTLLTKPIHITFRMTIKDALGKPAYTLFQVQPSGSILNLDTYIPNVASQVAVQYGPQGPKGDTGPAYSISTIGNLSGNFADAVVSGTVDGSNATFSVSGVSGAYWMVYKNGIRLLNGRDYSASGTQLTLTNAPSPDGLGVGIPDVISVTSVAPV